MTAYGEAIVKYKATGKLLPKKAIRLLWHSDYYDGPISGVALYDYKFYYYLIEYEDRLTSPRIYAGYKLTTEQFKDLLLKHELWRIIGGHHCDYDPHNNRINISQWYINQGEYHKLKDLYPTPTFSIEGLEPDIYFRL